MIGLIPGTSVKLICFTLTLFFQFERGGQDYSEKRGGQDSPKYGIANEELTRSVLESLRCSAQEIAGIRLGIRAIRE